MEIEKNKNEVFKNVRFYLVTGIAFILIRTFLFSPIEVDGASMYPSLEDEDKIVINKLSHYDRFDIIVFKGSNKKNNYVKRIIGLPGDKIHFKNDELFINDEVFDEPYLATLKESVNGGKLTGSFNFFDLYGSYEVPSGHYFVLGDNRIDSIDSRHPYIIGLVKDEQIMGEVEFIFYPYSHMKWIR